MGGARTGGLGGVVLNATPFFLAPDYVRVACEECAFPKAITEALQACAARVLADPALRRLALARYETLYRTEPFPRAELREWPLLADAAHPDGDLFYVLVALAGLPEMRAFYRERSIPDDVYRAGLSDVLRWMEDYRARTSSFRAWGLGPRYLGWLRHHIKGELFHLGRLQFEPGRGNVGAHFFRRRDRRRVLALSEDGLVYRADGQLQGAGGVTDEVGQWTATFTRDERAATGYPLSPFGSAIPDKVTLSLEEWEPILSPGNPTLNVHMPAGSPMDFDACGESFARALEFFPRYLPEHRFVAFVCSSWLLDPQLDGPMPPQSNIVRFQRQVYLLPSPSGGGSTLERVFGSAEVDLTRAPRDTALRRAVIGIVERGGHVRSGRCALFPEELRSGGWGGERYRRGTLKRKAFAYVTHRDAAGERLLIFSHPEAPEAGLQVPAGSLEEGEEPAGGALREAHEETNLPLSDLRVVRPLGEHLKDMRPWKDELHHRHFFHVRCTAPKVPERWRTYELSGSDEVEAGVSPEQRTKHLFECFWVHLPNGVPPLVIDHARFLPELMRSLGLSAAGLTILPERPERGT